MNKTISFLLILLLSQIAVAVTNVIPVDLKQETDINGIGPLLVKVDSIRNRIIAANSLSASVSIIDGKTHEVVNISTASRTPQHLKTKALTLCNRTGTIYLIGHHCFHIIWPEQKSSKTIETEKQFECIAVSESSGNVFLAGQESKELGVYNSQKGEFVLQTWLQHEEKRRNLNATPPPPRRKVIADNRLQQLIAVDGYESMLYVYDANTARLLSRRKLNLKAVSRWHFAGYNQKNHSLYLVLENKSRHVIHAAKIDILAGDDQIVDLPGYREGQGINYNSSADQVYISYDNAASLHVVDFAKNGRVYDIPLPTFGNDAIAVDEKNSLVYNLSWVHGEIDAIDIKTKSLMKRTTGLGILPHMFSAALNPNSGKIYFPRGATAVNGVFGASLCVFTPQTGKLKKIHTGWAPVDLIEFDSTAFLVFNNENEFARVRRNGDHQFYPLPYDYPLQAIDNGYGDICLSYGPHQSYWPTVYIWDAKNGILTIDRQNLDFYDRRIPRQALQMTLDKNKVLYFTQNNWGTEPQFIGRLYDPIRLFQIGNRILLPDTVKRETTQRVLKYDSARHNLYLLRVGERDTSSSVLQIVDPDSNALLHSQTVGVGATDLIFDKDNIYIANFGSHSVSIIDKISKQRTNIATGKGPLFLARIQNSVAVINHLDNSLQLFGKKSASYDIPFEGYPDNIYNWQNKLIITSHSSEKLSILLFDPHTQKFKVCHQEFYPFGDTRFNSRNTSFSITGQYGDAIFVLNRIKQDQYDHLWITDFLSGKCFVIEK